MVNAQPCQGTATVNKAVHLCKASRIWSHRYHCHAAMSPCHPIFSIFSPQGNKGLHSIDELRYPCGTQSMCALSMSVTKEGNDSSRLWESLCWRAEHLASRVLMYLKSSLYHCHASLKLCPAQKNPTDFHFKKKRDHMDALGFFFCE